MRDYVSNPNGHVWALNEEGEVDFLAQDAEFHNGPRCVKCGFTFCEHCDGYYSGGNEVPACKENL